MANLQYSIEGRNVLNKFHRVDRVLYVEGDDDVAFWEVIFEKVGGPLVKIEECGGKKNLTDRILEIKSGVANYLVAIDSDYDAFVENDVHRQVIRTRGYSIENTIVSARVLHRVICRIAKKPKSSLSLDACSQWLSDIESVVKKLIVFDVVNRVEGRGVAILGDNCDRFMTSKKSGVVCQDKIRSYTESLPFKIDDEQFNMVGDYVVRFCDAWLDIIRGHFLMALAYRFVKSCVGKIRSDIPISKEMFFSNMLFAFESSFNGSHSHYDFYQSAVKFASAEP